MSKRQVITYLLDSSVWIALAIERHTFHPKAQIFFDEKTEPQSLLFCRATQQTLLRLLTTDSILRAYGMITLTNQEAWDLYDSLESHSKVGFMTESVGHDRLWRELSALKTTSPKVWMDSYLAAFAIANDLTVVSLDKDFAQYPGLKLELLN